MSMIPCPGCGLPRIEDQLATVPCPVCAASPVMATAPPAAKKPPAHDPTAGLPSDVSELHRTPTQVGTNSRFLGWVVVFFLGVGTGVGGLFGWQTLYAPKPSLRDSRLDTASVYPGASPPVSLPTLTSAVAPMPHVSQPHVALTPDVQPKPKPLDPQPAEPKIVPLEGARVEDLGNQPEATFTAPVMRKGERLILKGKVQTLRVIGLDGGSVLDASGLEAATIYVGGKLDGGSMLKLYAPAGVVTVAAPVSGKSSVEINAPAGTVIFPTQTAPTRPGSSIDGGSRVTITARAVDLRGDVNGIETKVRVNLPGTGSLKIAAIRGIAIVEYRVTDENGMPDVSASTVAPTAILKKVG